MHTCPLGCFEGSERSPNRCVLAGVYSWFTRDLQGCVSSHAIALSAVPLALTLRNVKLGGAVSWAVDRRLQKRLLSLEPDNAVDSSSSFVWKSALSVAPMFSTTPLLL